MVKDSYNRTKGNCSTDGDAVDSSSNRDGRGSTVVQVDENASALLNKSQIQKVSKVNSGKFVKYPGNRTRLVLPRGAKQQVQVQKNNKGVLNTEKTTTDNLNRKIATKVEKLNLTNGAAQRKTPTTKTGSDKKPTSKKKLVNENFLKSTSRNMENFGEAVTKCGKENNVSQCPSNLDIAIDCVARGLWPTTGLNKKLERKHKNVTGSGSHFTLQTITEPNPSRVGNHLSTLTKLNKKSQHKFDKTTNAATNKLVNKRHYPTPTKSTKTKSMPKSKADYQNLPANNFMKMKTQRDKNVTNSADRSNGENQNEVAGIKKKPWVQKTKLLNFDNSVDKKPSTQKKRKMLEGESYDSGRKGMTGFKQLKLSYTVVNEQFTDAASTSTRSILTEELNSAKKKRKQSSASEEAALAEMGKKKRKNLDTSKRLTKIPDKNIMSYSNLDKQAFVYLEDISKSKHYKELYLKSLLKYERNEEQKKQSDLGTKMCKPKNSKSVIDMIRSESETSTSVDTPCTSRSLVKTSLASSKLSTSSAKCLRTSENSSLPQTKSHEGPVLANNYTSKDYGAWSKIANIQITHSVTAQSRIVKCIPLSGARDDVVPQSCAVLPEDHLNYNSDYSDSVEDDGDEAFLSSSYGMSDFNRINYAEYDLLWEEDYTFCDEDTLRILGHDYIFEDAVVSSECTLLTEIDSCSSLSERNEQNGSTQTQQLHLPILRRTVTNDYVNRNTARQIHNQSSSSDSEGESHMQATSKQGTSYRSTASLHSEEQGGETYAGAPTMDLLHTEHTSNQSACYRSTTSLNTDRGVELRSRSSMEDQGGDTYAEAPTMDLLHTEHTSNQSACYRSTTSLNTDTGVELHPRSRTNSLSSISSSSLNDVLIEDIPQQSACNRLMPNSLFNLKVKPTHTIMPDEDTSNFAAEDTCKQRGYCSSNSSNLEFEQEDACTTANTRRFTPSPTLSIDRSYISATSQQSGFYGSTNSLNSDTEQDINGATNTNDLNIEMNSASTTSRISPRPQAARDACNMVNTRGLQRSNVSPTFDTFNTSPMVVGSGNQNSQFRMPSLPPAKRPPTRIARNLNSLQSRFSDNVSSSTTHRDNLIPSNQPNVQKAATSEPPVTEPLCSSDFPSTANDNDDVLSLWAGSVFSLNLNQNERRELRTLSTDKEDRREFQDRPSNTNQSNEATMTARVPDKAAERSHMPLVFRGLCWFYWTPGGCRRRHCGRVHVLQREMEAKITSLDKQRLEQAYQFAKIRPLLYKELLSYFICAFKKLKSVDDLLAMVGNILEFQTFNKTPFIIEIVEALEALDISFRMAITCILERQNKATKATISDILLEIVFERQKDLFHNWGLVKQLTRKEPLDHGLVGDLMYECSLHNNEKLGSADNIKQLAKNIIHDIVKLGQVNLLAIGTSTCNKFLSKLYFFNLVAEAKILVEKMKSRGLKITAQLQNTSSPINQAVGDNRSSTVVPEYRQLNRSDAHKSPSLDSNNSHECNDQVNTSDLVSVARQKTPNLHDSNETEIEDTDLQNTDVDSNKSSYSAKSLNQTPWSESHYNVNEIGSKNPQIALNCDVDDLDYEYSNDQNDTSVLVESVPSPQGLKNIEDDTTDEYDERNSDAASRLSSSLPENTLLLSNADVKHLKDTILNENSWYFYKMLIKFKSKASSRSFILHTLCCFKKRNSEEIYKLFMSVLDAMEILNPTFMTKDEDMKNMFEVLAINTIGILAGKYAYNAAARILEKFPDLDSLKKTTWYPSIYSQLYTESGKYLYFCNMFIKGGLLEQAWNMLVSREWMLQSSHTWELQWKDPYDVISRDSVVRRLITTCLETDIDLARDIIFSLISSNIDDVTGIDPWKYYNQLLMKMLDNCDMYIDDLVGMIDSIIDGWYKHIEKSILRGLLVVLLQYITNDQALNLYEKSAKQNSYPTINGDERIIELKTDMSTEEIYMTLNVFFIKIIKNDFLVQDIVLKIRLPDRSVSQPNGMINNNVSVQVLKNRIYEVLAKGFDFIINVRTNSLEPQIVVEADQMQPCIDYYRTSYLLKG